MVYCQQPFMYAYGKQMSITRTHTWNIDREVTIMKKARNVLALTLAVVLTAGALSACGGTYQRAAEPFHLRS